MKKIILTILSVCFFTGFLLAQDKHNITVKANKPGAEIQPTMWGIFFEDINMAADGGIYAELVKNRSFEFSKPMDGWTVQPVGDRPYQPFQKQFGEGTVVIVNREDKNAVNPRFIRITTNNATKDSLGLTNEGFRGMGIKKDMRYDFSLMYRNKTPGLKMHVELVDSTGTVLGSTMFTPREADGNWHKQAETFTANATEAKAKLTIWFEGSGIIDLDMISLFPEDTWKNRPGGLRADLVQMLADLKPGFVRFPGGCIVEGRELATRYQWKKTIGPVEDRQLIINRWNTEFASRSTPDYFQTFGLGFFEYFRLAEDIGAEPLPILNCGMACQFNTAEVATLDQIDPYLQDALDLVEFANGDVNTQWGAVRAKLGHPEPFNLKMMGVGNENWGPQYIDRFKIFQKGLKEKYPQLKIIASTSAEYQGERFNYLNTEFKTLQPELADEHYYNSPSWFLQNTARYDNYDRSGPAIFAGEYAAHSSHTGNTENKNSLRTAVSEAAFMTGLERNADIVHMASYAPLLARVDAWQWKPDLIWFDNLNVYATPDYYVQKLFSNNKGTNVLPTLSNNQPLTGQDDLYASAVLDKKTHEVIIKIVNSSLNEKQINVNVEGVKKLMSPVSVTVLTGKSLEQENTLDDPMAISPSTQSVNVKGKKVDFTVKPNSLAVIRAGYN